MIDPVLWSAAVFVVSVSALAAGCGGFVASLYHRRQYKALAERVGVVHDHFGYLWERVDELEACVNAAAESPAIDTPAVAGAIVPPEFDLPAFRHHA